jgi:hypothetical protein
MRLGAASPAAMNGRITIAEAAPGDAAEIAAIYAHHVLHGVATWEVEPPGSAEMAARMGKVLDVGWPWLTARDEQGALLGFAYVGFTIVPAIATRARTPSTSGTTAGARAWAARCSPR